MAVQNLNYYRQRADEELAAAKRAADPSIAQIHRDMALRYRALIAVAGVPVEPAASGPVKEIGPRLAQA